MHRQIRGIGLFCALGPAVMVAQSTAIYQIATIAGSDLVGDAGMAVAAQLDQPEGLAVGADGSIYVADAGNHRIRKVTPDGVIVTIAGSGHPGFSGDHGPAVAAQLNQPYGLALDASGNLYVADYGNQRVRRIDGNGIITTVAGDGWDGSNADEGPATSALLVGPRNLAIDAAGNLYISEFDGHRVRRVAPDGTISRFAGTGIAGDGGMGGPAAEAQLAFPAGLAVDTSGSLYIVDTGNVRVLMIRGGAILIVCAKQEFGLPYGALSGIAADAAGNLFIPDGSFVFKLGSDRKPVPATNQILEGAVADLSLDTAGNLYVSLAHAVLQVNLTGDKVTRVAGDETFGFSGDGQSSLQAVLSAPSGLAMANGTLYIADQGNNRIRCMAPDGTMSTMAGGGLGPGAGDGGAATQAILLAPASLTFDALNNLFVADTNHNLVRSIDPMGTITTAAGNGSSQGYGCEGCQASTVPLAFPKGVAADSKGSIYIADSSHNRVIQVDAAGAAHTVAGTGTPGSVENGELSELRGPTGLAIDSDGNLYIADTGNHRIRMLTAAGAISTVAGTGASGFNGDGGLAVDATLNSPSGVAVDSGKNLYIADTGNNRIRIVTPDGNISTIAGTGDASLNGESGPAIQIALSNPSGLAIDDQGNLLIADTGNNRVRLLSKTVKPPPVLVTVTVVNGASFQDGPVAPGEIISIIGDGLGPDTGVTGGLNASGMLASTLGNTQVLFDGIPAPLFYVQAKQINAQAPFELAGRTSTQLQVTYQGAVIASQQMAVADASPAVFTVNYGSGNAAAVNADGTLNSGSNPAARGSIVVLYATGAGQTNAAGITGQAAQAPYSLPVLPVSLTIGNAAADVLWAGSAPGFVGLLQINARVPSGFVPPGDLPVVLSVGTYQSPGGVTIAVR